MWVSDIRSIWIWHTSNNGPIQTGNKYVGNGVILAAAILKEMDKSDNFEKEEKIFSNIIYLPWFTK